MTAKRQRLKRERIRSLLSGWREHHSVREWRLARALGRRFGYHVVPATYYSPIPDFDALPESTWELPSPMPGVSFDLDRQLQMIDSELGSYLAEFDPPSGPPGDQYGFFRNNPTYGPVDADLLYAMVRRHRPSRVLELGSGFSTLVIAGAAARNAQAGQPLLHTVVDPFPSELLEHVSAPIQLRKVPANEVRVEEFAELAAGDLLFIDTTHTLKPGSDAVYLLLEAIPSVQPGVLIHLHDVYRPFEYPRRLYELFGYWQEHYAVQAFLAFNREYEVLCATHALCRLRRDWIRTRFPSYHDEIYPSSFWMRRVA